MIINLTDIRKYEKDVLFNGVCKARQDYSVRFSKQKSEKNVKLSLASEYSLNQIMTRIYPKMTLPLDIKHDKSGCPIFSDKTVSEFKNKYDINPYFSLSHSGDYACSVISDYQVGIDIEKMEKRDGDKISNFAHRFFAREETEWINSDVVRFYMVWCAKEAFLKASGLAGKLAMSGFRVKIIEESKINSGKEINLKYDYQADDNQSGLYVGKILLDKSDEGYMMAVCSLQNSSDIIDCEIFG